MDYDKKEAKARLEARLDELRDRVGEIDETLREPEDDDFEEQATEIGDDHVLDRLGKAGRDEARRVIAALQRLEEGTYGTCVTCGKPISEGRLKALPEAEQCMNCADGAGKRRK